MITEIRENLETILKRIAKFIKTLKTFYNLENKAKTGMTSMRRQSKRAYDESLGGSIWYFY